MERIPSGFLNHRNIHSLPAALSNNPARYAQKNMSNSTENNDEDWEINFSNPPDTEDRSSRNGDGSPGTWIPYVRFQSLSWGSSLSTHDLIGAQILVLTGSPIWYKAVTQLTNRLGIAIAAHCVGDDLIDVEGGWTEAFGITSRGIVIVRPDGIVQWRAATDAKHPQMVLEEALLGLLYSSPEG